MTKGNLTDILSGSGDLPAGFYAAVVNSARLRQGKGIYADVVFKIVAPELHAGKFISEQFTMVGEGSAAPRRSRRALMQLAADAGVEDMRDLVELVGARVELSLIDLSFGGGETHRRIVFPRPAECYAHDDTHLDPMDLV